MFTVIFMVISSAVVGAWFGYRSVLFDRCEKRANELEQIAAQQYKDLRDKNREIATLKDDLYGAYTIIDTHQAELKRVRALINDAHLSANPLGSDEEG